MIVFRGRFRVYWNRALEAPLVWSVDDGAVENEMKVSRVKIRGAVLQTECNMNNDHIREPRGWIEGMGIVEIIGTEAIITGIL